MTSRPPQRGVLERALGLFSDVRAGEGARTLLFLLNVFLVLVGYYVIKTVREPLILATGGAEYKSYAAAVQAAVLVLFVPLYSYVASRVSTPRLIVAVLLFFLGGLQLFYLGLAREVPLLGFVFYVWVGIFNVSVIALFWSFANEVHDPEAGERLFPVIGIGASGGAWAGSKIAEWLFGAGFSPGALLQVAAAILAAHLGLYLLILRRDRHRARARTQREPSRRALGDALAGFALVFSRRYVALIAVLLILLNLANSVGEYILGSYVVERAAEALAGQGPGVDAAAFKQQYIGAFMGGFFSWVNLGGVLLQAFVASRLVRRFGIGGALFALPLVAFGTYALVALGASFALFRWAKTAENATDYSVMNTAKNMLWLVTTREEKYQAKQAVDTFFVRVGDVLAAGLVLGGTTIGFTRSTFATTNLVIVAVWMLVAWVAVRSYTRLAGRAAAQAGTDR